MTTKAGFQSQSLKHVKDYYDVVIIGSGSSGLTSALQAYELGIKPVILEKMPSLGGNTKRASSGLNAAETYVQLQHQVVDSYEEFYNDVYQGGGCQNNPQLLHYFTEHSALAIDWLSAQGIFLEDLTITGGMKVKRTHRSASLAPIGNYLITGLLKRMAQLQIPIFTNVTVTQLLQKQGQIKGVKILSNAQSKIINTNAVILATGGFGANTEMIKKYCPNLAALKTTNQQGAQGDGILLAQQLGAQLVDMEQIQVHPTVQQDGKHPYLIGEAVRGEGAILVDKQGRRFVNELQTRQNVTTAINNLHENGATLIFDQNVRKRVPAIEFYDQIGLVKSGQNWAELAAKNQFDNKTLQETVQKWNQAVLWQQDQQFGRQTGMEQPLNQAPYYSIHVAPAVHYTMGGLAINTKTQVLQTNGQVIPGLFAAGEVTGGLHGNNRIGGNSIAETIVFGRQAGQQAFKYLQNLK